MKIINDKYFSMLSVPEDNLPFNAQMFIHDSSIIGVDDDDEPHIFIIYGDDDDSRIVKIYMEDWYEAKNLPDELSKRLAEWLDMKAFYHDFTNRQHAIMTWNSDHKDYNDKNYKVISYEKFKRKDV